MSVFRGLIVTSGSSSTAVATSTIAEAICGGFKKDVFAVSLATGRGSGSSCTGSDAPAAPRDPDHFRRALVSSKVRFGTSGVYPCASKRPGGKLK